MAPPLTWQQRNPGNNQGYDYNASQSRLHGRSPGTTFTPINNNPEDMLTAYQQLHGSMTGFQGGIRPNMFNSGGRSNAFGAKYPNFYNEGGAGNPPEQPFSWSGAAGKVGDWMGNNPMKVAGLGLGLWDQYNKSEQLDQNKQYMGNVQNAMRFDQADVNRRWDLTMKDYNSRIARDDKFDNSQRLPTEV